MAGERQAPTDQPHPDAPGRPARLGAYLLDAEIAQVVEHNDTSVLLRKRAKRLYESDTFGGRAFDGALFVMTLHELHTAPHTPEAGNGEPPGRGADPRLLGTVAREYPPSTPGPYERLLHDILSLRQIAGHRVKLPNEPGVGQCVELIELLFRRASRHSSAIHFRPQNGQGSSMGEVRTGTDPPLQRLSVIWVTASGCRVRAPALRSPPVQVAPTAEEFSCAMQHPVSGAGWGRRSGPPRSALWRSAV